jgi:DNA-binding MarR family transcriptional regulator
VSGRYESLGAPLDRIDRDLFPDIASGSERTYRRRYKLSSRMSPNPRSPTAHRRALSCIRALVARLYHSARSVESRTGLTNAQLAILRNVARNGPLTINETAQLMRAGQSGVSSVLSRLERAKLVERTVSETDRRRVLVHATATGRRMLRRSPLPPTEELLSALDQLTPAQAEAIARGLTALLRKLHRGVTPEHMLFE